MNGLRADGLGLAAELAKRAKSSRLACDLLVCPPATLLVLVGDVLQGRGIALGGQDCHAAPKGAFTGSLTAEMLSDVGCSHAMVGHSERRHGNGETNADGRAKALAAWHAGLVAVVCVGETREGREGGRAFEGGGRPFERGAAQGAGSMPEGATADNRALASEPVWAIGTGLTPTLDDIAR